MSQEYWDTRNRRLCEQGCGRQACFGFGRGPAVLCATHAAPGMKNLRAERCEADECGTQAAWGFPKESRRRFCSIHRLPGMRNLAARRCQSAACFTRPSFGVSGTKKMLYCANHAAPGMVNLQLERQRRAQLNVRPIGTSQGTTSHVQVDVASSTRHGRSARMARRKRLFRLSGRLAVGQEMGRAGRSPHGVELGRAGGQVWATTATGTQECCYKCRGGQVREAQDSLRVKLETVADEDDLGERVVRIRGDEDNCHGASDSAGTNWDGDVGSRLIHGLANHGVHHGGRDGDRTVGDEEGKVADVDPRCLSLPASEENPFIESPWVSKYVASRACIRHCLGNGGAPEREAPGVGATRKRACRVHVDRVLAVRDTGTRGIGKGVFATEEIPGDAFLLYYEGERIPRSGLDVDALECPEERLRYVWELSDGSFIDAGPGDHASRYLNHFQGLAPAPNVVAREVIDADLGLLQVAFFSGAGRAIAPGEQLVIDYGPQYAQYDWEAAERARADAAAAAAALIGGDALGFSCPAPLLPIY
eukprot:jgi/Mesvir1/27621/Mv07353-RA.1